MSEQNGIRAHLYFSKVKKTLCFIMLSTLVFPLFSCASMEQSNSVPSLQLQSDAQGPENTVWSGQPSQTEEVEDYDPAMVPYLGHWRKVLNEDNAEIQSFHFLGDGRFIYLDETNERLEGKWTLEDNAILLEYDSYFMDQEREVPPDRSVAIKIVSYEGVSGLVLDGELYLDTQQQHFYYQTLCEEQIESGDFAGSWSRTIIKQAASAGIGITNQTESSFHFTINARSSLSIGHMNGVAYIFAPNQAYSYIEPRGHSEGTSGFILFTLRDDEMLITYDGDINALGFGVGVTVGGTYTKEEPVYVDAT